MEEEASAGNTNRDTSFVVDNTRMYKSHIYKKIATMAAIVIVVFGFVIGGLALFSGTSVQVVKHTETISLPSVAIDIAYADGSALAIPLSTTQSVSLQVISTEEEYVEKKASGSIIIYNNYSSDPQKLIKNTRFEAPGGNIYRIQDSVTVPGQKTVNGKKTPGSLEVTVYADKVGDTYNAGLVDFTIPGFKGTPQYDGFYARSKTAIAGGFAGTVKKVSEAETQKALATLKTDAFAKAQAALATSVPSNYLYIDSIGTPVYSQLTQLDSSEDTVTLGLDITYNTVLFSKEAFAAEVTKQSGRTYSPDDVFVISNIDDLSFSTESTISKEGTLALKIVGNPKLEWVVDVDKLAKDLSGISRKNIANILATYRSVEEAKAYIKPFWKTSVSSNVDDITINFVETIE